MDYVAIFGKVPFWLGLASLCGEGDENAGCGLELGIALVVKECV